MSFSVTCEKTGLEYSPSTLKSLFAQRRNLFRPRSTGCCGTSFGSNAKRGDCCRRTITALTLRDYLERKGYSQAFIDHFILPMGEAIWSADPDQSERFPARYFARFFKNHGFLKVRNQPRWLTIRGGSRRYVEPLTRPTGTRFASMPRSPPFGGHADRRRDRRRGRGPRTVRPGGCRHPQRPGFGAAGRPLGCRARGPRRHPLPGEPHGAPHGRLRCSHAARRRGPAGTTTSPGGPGPGRRHLRHEPPAEPQRSGASSASPSTSRRGWTPRRSSAGSMYHHPVYTPRGLAAQARHDEISGVSRTHYCGRLLGLRLPRGRGEQRPGRRPRTSERGLSVKSCLYEGHLRHRRFRPVTNAFRYRLFLFTWTWRS